MINFILERKISLSREGNIFKLTFPYSADLVCKVKELPYVKFDPETKSWSCEVTIESVELLRKWFIEEGLTDKSVDSLVNENENISTAGLATIRAGSSKRPFVVVFATRNENLYAKFKSIFGAQWDKKFSGITYPPTASVALLELVNEGILSDPSKLLTPSMLTIHFDSRFGTFHVSGDPRANIAFQLKYPNFDMVSKWRDKNIEVSFADPLSEEIYYGELNRNNLLNPVGLLKPLFDYQARSVAIATKRTGFAIWDQPGLGKTAQAIGWAFELIINLKSADRAIIVTPGSIKTQFKREIYNFTGHKDVLVIEGDKNNREKLYSTAKDYRWIILNYDLLHLDFKHILPIVNGQLLIADEAHRIKNRSSKRGIAMRSLSQKAQRRLALSGTPIENNPAEWYTIMNGFVVPGIFGSPIEFLNRYSYPGRFGGFEGARNLDELRARSQMHYIRNLKKDVATQLPILQVNNQILDPDEKYANALKLAHRDAKNEIEEKAFERSFSVDFTNIENHESGAAMTATSMLRLMCSSPKLLHLSDSISAKVLCEAGLIPDIDGPKLDYFRSLAKEYQRNNERILLFTSFRKMAKLIAQRLDEDSIPYVLYTGESSTKEREKAIIAFTTVNNHVDNNPVVFIATDAAAEGLNLGKECSTIVNFDLSFKPSVMIQRANRIHRIDSDPNRRYRVINLTLAKTLEEGILQAIGNKADLSDAILGEVGTRLSTTGRNPKKILQDVLGSYDFS